VLENATLLDTLSAMKKITLPLLSLLLLLTAGCDPLEYRKPPKPAERHVTLEARQTSELSDREYLMRKATLGSRAERVEALDVIERSSEPELLPFLLARLDKEDDRFLQIRIMHALSAYGDVRAVPPLRYYARWDTSRVGVEATVALYELGDETFVPRLINRLRTDDENPEMTGIAHRALKRMTGADLPPSQRAWLNYTRSHPVAPYQTHAWYWPFRQPLPLTVEGGTRIAVKPAKGRAPLPKEDVKVRRTNVTWSEFWRNDE